jgi:hypothetical protein
MAQGVLPFKYEEEKRESGMTALAGLPVYLDLARGAGIIGEYIAVSPREEAGLDGCTDGVVVDVIEPCWRDVR